MHLRKRPSIRFTLESFPKYLRNEIDVDQLAGELNRAESLLENDIPKPVRDVIKWASSELEHIRFACPEDREQEEVGKIWREVEEVVARHIPLEEQED